VTPQEMRQVRLRNDHREMSNIRGEVVKWRPLRGTEPTVEAYELTVGVRSIIGPRPDYRSEHRIQIELPPGYPRAAPVTVMTSQPQPFHPNWFPNGRWCYGTWDFSESLANHILRMIRTLQFDPEITNPASPANVDANRWYLRHLNGTLFPCDRTVLPDPTRSRFRVESGDSQAGRPSAAPRRTFRINDDR